MPPWKIAVLLVSSIVPLASCATRMDPDHVKKGVSLGPTAQPHTTLWDTNGDGKPDVLRWQKGTSQTFEKLDTDYDGYWEMEGTRQPDGGFFTRLTYPVKSYGVTTHHRFFPLEAAPE